MQKKKDIWFALGETTPTSVLEKVFNLEYTTLLLPVELLGVLDRVTPPRRLRLAVLVRGSADLDLFAERAQFADMVDYVLSTDIDLLDEIRTRTQKQAGFCINVKDRATLDRTVALAPRADVVVIDFTDPTNIPLELVLATTQSTTTRIFKRVSDAQDGEVSLLTMEKGSDGILMSSNDLNEIVRLSQVFERSELVQFDVKPAKVIGIKHAGMGDRVCIDTTSELRADEGMMLGSTSSGGILVSSETHYLPYMNLRPFRVNAGGMHLYVWGPNNFVAYLSDLRAGDRVYAMDVNGKARVVTIGRMKIERRPLLLIECEIEGKRVNVFIQDDWHVRVFGGKGEVRPSSEIKIGDELLGYLDQPGRHVGIKIQETIREV